MPVCTYSANIFFEMAAMPFPSNGLLLCCVNLPSCSSINLLVVLSLILIFYWGWPSFGLKQFLMVAQIVPQVVLLVKLYCKL